MTRSVGRNGHFPLLWSSLDLLPGRAGATLPFRIGDSDLCLLDPLKLLLQEQFYWNTPHTPTPPTTSLLAGRPREPSPRLWEKPRP